MGWRKVLGAASEGNVPAESGRREAGPSSAEEQLGGESRGMEAERKAGRCAGRGARSQPEKRGAPEGKPP